MKLYSYWRSSCSWRVRIALHYKGISFDTIPVHLTKDGGRQHSAEFRAQNPLSQVPALVLEDGAVLTQSLAILEYLEEKWSTPSILPKDKVLRYRARQLAEIVNAGIQPLQNLAVLQHLTSLDDDAKKWARSVISKGLAAMEVIAQQTAGKFLVGDVVSIADICLIPQLYNARRFNVDMSLFSRLRAIEAATIDLPAFVSAHPDNQPDAVK